MLAEEFDLRPYIEAIYKRWLAIIIVTIVAAGIGFGIGAQLPLTYRATAIISVIESSDTIQFDGRFTDVNEPKPLNAVPELAISDEVLRQLQTVYSGDQPMTLGMLSTSLVVNRTDDPSIVQ